MIGVLALQGGFDAHVKALTQLNLSSVLIKTPEALRASDVTTLIIPGGESSALLKLMAPLNWLDTLVEFHQQGNQLLGTCAGMILLAKSVQPDQASLGLIDIDVVRKGYGRQLESFIGQGQCVEDQAHDSIECVFIRAPKVSRVGNDVEVIMSCQGLPVLLREGRVSVCSFHPELSSHLVAYRHFLKAVVAID